MSSEDAATLGRLSQPPAQRDLLACRVAAALVVVIAAVHFEQYVDFMSHIPTIGVLFLLNAAGGAGLAVALISHEPLLRLAAAAGAVGLALGSLVSIALALGGGIFGYQEPTLRLPIALAIAAEVLVLPVLALVSLVALRESRQARQRPPATGQIR